MAYSPDRNLVLSPLGRPSVEKKCAQPYSSVSAEPAGTDVNGYSAADPIATERPDRSGHRSFSTKIVSQGSIHEIIWDEKVIPGKSNSSSSSISQQPTRNNKYRTSSSPRKQSTTVEKLETQLRREISHLRCVLPGGLLWGFIKLTRSLSGAC
jgi:hypothetical protein